jgi:hypothetical protein
MFQAKQKPTAMAPDSASATFRLTASAIASHFKHRCDRLFRWNAVASPDRGRAGIGWNVPRRARDHSRPGIALLMDAGNAFELGRVQALEAALQAEPPMPGLIQRVHHAGVIRERGRDALAPLPLAEALELLRQPLAPRFVAQLAIDLAPFPAVAAHALERFGLDPALITLGVARPDLVELLPPDATSPLRRLRVWDFKGSQVARHEHFIQVAFYSMLLEAVLEALAISDLAVDTAQGVVEAREERTSFELGPYRLAVADFLRNRVPALLATPAAEAHFHVQEGCVLCEYMEECRAQANAAFDLSRIPYLSSESKRQLRAAGLRSHDELAALDADADAERIARLGGLSHDLARNLPRYIAAAQALHDGEPRLLAQRSFQMPQHEDVRVVLCAEQDAVSGTVFALGIKAYEGWDEARQRPLGQEHVFIARAPGDEASILLPFLQTLNRLLERVHGANEAVRAQPLEGDPALAAAEAQAQALQARLEQFKLEHAVAMRKRSAEALALREQRDAIQGELEAARRAAKEARSAALRVQRRAQQRLHFYIYDSLDLLALKGLIERHLFDQRQPELLAELSSLVRLFPPESVLPDAETFRTIPATIVVQMLRALVALPIPYGYDLRSVSARYQPASGGYEFRTPYGFSWEHSNQIAFERIHDVWSGASFRYQSRGTQRVLGPEAILAEIEKAVLAKLRATDAVVRRLKADLQGQLLLKKEPFRLYTGASPLETPLLEALRIFTTLEVSLDELETKQAHALPLADRVAGLVCMRGLRAEAATLDEEGALWFRFDPASADAKFEPGDFNLVLTPEDDPTILLAEVDGELYASSNRWRYAAYKVTLLALDLQARPPRARLAPDNPKPFLNAFDPQRSYALDRLFVDYNSAKVFEVLRRLAAEGEAGHAHIQALLAEATIDGWEPLVPDAAALEAAFRARLLAAGADPERLLNAGQWRAWRGVLGAPLTLLWGPPGTGKTHTIAHMLVGYALAARLLERPPRVLVTAFTHHAINNVLAKLAELAARYGLGDDELRVLKLKRAEPHASDAALPARVRMCDTDGFAGELSDDSPCTIVGATVWGLQRAMQKGGDSVQPWFDVILVDEASQLKLADALIAFAASKANASIILAGDDRQLPPIIRGRYPDEQAHILGSVFAFVRERIERQRATRPELEGRALFQLEENFRMNEPLTAYPRDVLYGGRFFATRPDIRMATGAGLDPSDDELIALLLDPARPVMLVRYRPPRSFTARNPLEAELAAALVARLAGLLIDGASGAPYTPEGLAREGVAVLSPHRAQNSSIRQLLRERGFGTQERPMPLVDTVDKLQGQERDVVVVSYGVADGEYAEAEAAFLLSSNRFNVAATRARHKLIVICADSVLEVVPADQQVLLDAMMLKEFRRYCDGGPRAFAWATSQGEGVTLQVQWRAFPT